ncbi:TPA: cysteine ABC transporter permease, partial [Mannheimia haemolytica]|nr:cysteine ABC transporter permease [Mannheimia haemolytica]
MLNDLLLSIPFMTQARVDLVLSGFWPMVQAAFLVSIPLAIASFIIGMLIAVAVALVRISPATGFF